MEWPSSDKGIFRFLAIATLAALIVTLAVALPGVSAGGDEDKNKDMEQGQAPPIPDKAELKYPNLGSHLDQLVTSVEEGETTAEEAAGDTSMHREESVAVTIYLSGNVADVVAFLEDSGGDPRNVGEDYIEAYVPLTLLGPVSEQPGVIRVREIVPPQEEFGPITSQGVQAHLSAAWNNAGHSGQGVKVGIIDGGFEGFSGLMGTELPATVVSRCYTDIGVFTQNLSDCEVDSEHGTIVSESLIDIAPEVSLYISNADTKGDLQTAADWMIAEGVSVINTSLTWTFDGPGDGTSPFSFSPLKAVDRAVDGGVVWVTAAGNQADTTWFGVPRSFSGVFDSGRFMYFAGTDVGNDVSLEAGDVVRVQLRWDDSWGGATSDLDVCILPTTTPVGRRGTCSRDDQFGENGHVPSEFLTHDVAIDGDWYVVVLHVGGNVPDWIQLIVSGDAGSIDYYTGTGSIGNPAESAKSGLLAVGAAHWDDVRAIEPYSGRGPTPDGREKPDIVGADCGATALSPLDEDNEGFCGTSQATPHVAGMSALVKQRFPSYTPAQVAGYLKDFAAQREGPAPNNTWGYGFAQLPPPDGAAPPTTPTLSNAFTRNPAADFNGLISAGNIAPRGIWSDGETMWVADWLDEKIYAYDKATKARTPGRDFDTLEAAGNTWPHGIWSDGETMWVADWLDEKIYAYDKATKARTPGRDFDTLEAAGNTWPHGIWSDGTTMWVADWLDEKIYAYDKATKARLPGKDFDTLEGARNQSPQGIWSDGTTMWVADGDNEKVYAYDIATRERTPDREFNTLITAGNFEPRGIWSDGTTMWVADWDDERIYAYHMTQEAPDVDREALTSLYNATGGADWTNNTNWLTNAPIGQWYGVTTDANGRVTNLVLGNNQLSGTIPTQLGNLANLQELHITRNQLTGEIPAELGSLTSLEILALGGNQLTGTIPTWLGGLTTLEEVYLWGNELTGTIPAELGSLANLVQLQLADNQLTGSIPTRLGSLSNLQELDFADNQLTGTIPTQLGSLANLQVLSFTRNQLTGEIPAELGSLTSLEILALGGNQLTGTIPTWLGGLTTLEEVYLWGNPLTGQIPSQLASLTNLRELHLSSNQLTGTIPTWLGSLSNLQELDFADNQLTGTIPTELGSLANLEELWLNSNQLTGEIPAELGRLTNLTVLYLSGNQLTGCVSASLKDVADNDFVQLGLPFCTVAPPAGVTATRSFAPASVSPGGEVVVTITAANYGAFGGVTETLPAGFSYVSSTHGSVTHPVDGNSQMVRFTLSGETSFTYTVTASDVEGPHTFSGTLTDSDQNVYPVGGDTMVTVGDATPGVTVSYAGTYPAARVRIGTAIPVIATFTESVTGFTVDDITVGNGTAGNISDSGASYTFDVTPNAIGQVTVDIAADVAMDAGDNGNTAAMQLPLGIPYDDNRNGTIEKSEVVAAINDYLFGDGSLEKSHVVALINLYLFG